MVRTGHASASSPLRTSAPSLTPEVIALWNQDRVQKYLQRNQTSAEWQQAFRNLNIRGQEFLELAHNDGLVNHVLPEVMRISPTANEQMEYQQALRIKGYLNDMLELAQDDRPPTGSLTRTQANRRTSGQRSSTLPSYAENGYKGSSDNLHRIPASEQNARSRNEYSKGALASVEPPIRHSPSSSETNFPHSFGGLSASPHSSPNLGHRDISTRHGKSNSTESIASSTLSHRAGDGKGDQKALKILGIVTRSDKDANHERVVRQDSYDKHTGGGKIVHKIRKKFFPKDGEVEEESPTSPSWRGGYAAQSPFATDRNESSSSIDRVSISSFDGPRKPHAFSGTTGTRNKLYVFVTKDTRMFVLCDLTGLEKVEDVRKRICLDVGILDYHIADICLTEAGQKEHDEGISDQVLLWHQSKADSCASLKFFVRPRPQSTVDSVSSTLIDKEFPVSPSKNHDFLTEPRPLFADRQTAQVPVAEPTDSASTTLTQGDFEKQKKSIEQYTETGRISPPLPAGDNLDDLRERLATLGKNYSDNPQINVIQPYSPVPPMSQSAPNTSIQPSPNDVPEYPDWDSGPTALKLQQDPSSASPVDAGPSPAGRDELFFNESPASAFALSRPGHKGSAGSNKLEEAARQKLEPTPSGQQRPSEPSKSRPPEPDKGFSKVRPGAARGPRVVDFDNPRPSPYEEKKIDDLVPQRRPPPPPINRTGSNSWSKSMNQQWAADIDRAHGSYAPVQRKKSVDRRPHARAPEMLQKGRPGQGGSPIGGVGNTATAFGALAAGAIAGGITGTRIPGVSGSTPSSASSRRDHSVDSGSRRQVTPTSGSLPSPEGEAGPQKLSLKIPTAPQPRRNPDISPRDRIPPPRMRTPSYGNEIPFKENDVQFMPAQPEAAELSDSDEDNGLFAIPISSRVDKPKVELSRSDGVSTEPPSAVTDSSKPTLSIATKIVKFKTPSTGSATESGSANTDPNTDQHTDPNTDQHTDQFPEFEAGDDRQGLNSPSVHSSSGPTSAAAHPHSPADYSRLGRRNSFREDVWASRPPAEALINNLDEFFPNVNLDEPMIDSPPPSPSPATEKPQSYQLSDPPLPPQIKEHVHENVLASEPSMGPPPIPPQRKSQPAVVQRNIGRSSGVGRMKSIREVAKGAHESRKRYTQPAVGEKHTSMPMRRKSTKLFGAKLIEVRPGEGRRNMQLQQQQQPPPEPGLSRQATFKWFKGQLIGKGTYGKVYLGMNATTGEFLAVKQVEISQDSEGSEHQKEMIAALNQEIITMQHLDHPNIVQYLGCETNKSAHMSIFLEYISGGSVGSCLRKHGRFEEPVVRSLTRQTLCGLQYLHSAGVLHRDLKADNLLLDVDGTCKISDFGISKKTDNIYGDDPGNSMQGSVFWMAPEVIRPEGQGYSAKIDIWSLGCVVLEMFAGRRPWSKEEAIGAIYKLGSEKQAPPIPDDVSSVITPEAIGFLADCHTIDPSDRPTAATLLAAHPFCAEDENFNFMETALYKKIQEKIRQ